MYMCVKYIIMVYKQYIFLSIDLNLSMYMYEPAWMWFEMKYNIRCIASILTWASIHKADGRLTARTREVSKPQESASNFFNRFDIWQTPRQQRCRDACRIAKRCDHYNIPFLRDFESSRDLVVTRLTI